MIDKIQLTNFQSHPSTTLNLHSGINAIIGTSDSGKTSILRALYWAVKNRPVGEAFTSYWTKDLKGKQVEVCSVQIEKGGYKLSRSKSKDSNQYKVNGTSLMAIGTDVPPEVKEFFNLSEVNIQKQMDAPFLLSSSSGEVARFFNHIIKLDEIDKALSLIDKKKRDCGSNIKRLIEEQEQLQIYLKSFGWIKRVKPLIDRAEEESVRIHQYEDELEQLGASIQTYETNLSVLRKTGSLLKLESVVEKIENIQKKLIEKERYSLLMESSLDQYRELINKLEAITPLINQEQTVERALKLIEKIENLKEKSKKVSVSLENYNDFNEKIVKMDLNLKEMKDQMPDVCPLCNGTGRVK